MNLNQARKMAKELIAKHCPHFTFEFNNAKTIFGICYHRKMKICLSRPLTRVGTEESVRDTILHEIAHAISPINTGHGRQWIYNCLKVGANPERCARDKNSIPIKECKYIYVCTICGKESGYHRKLKVRRACSECCKKYNGGMFSEKYELVMQQTIRLMKEDIKNDK